MTDDRSAAEYAAAIASARQRLIGFADDCPDQDWGSSPLDGDPRPVGVVVDHVAHAYEYIAGWLRQILAGQAVKVTSDIVDGLNAVHAEDAGQLDADEGRVRLFAQISIRHADDHRAEIEAALGRPG